VTLQPLRAGDSDRAAVVDLLRAHHLDGRLTLEEFEERVERAQHAVTLVELGDLHGDLPELQPRRGKVVRRTTRAPRIPGRLAFVERVHLSADPALAREHAFVFIAPALASHGYKLSVHGDALVFSRLRRPGWTIALSILAFPVGMLALLHTESDEVVVVIEPAPGGGSTLLAHGVAPLAVRRPFARLGD
jgi:hypothetical protein